MKCQVSLLIYPLTGLRHATQIRISEPIQPQFINCGKDIESIEELNNLTKVPGRKFLMIQIVLTLKRLSRFRVSSPPTFTYLYRERYF
jgi:hypothetical protein